MKKLELLTSGVNVMPLHWALLANPELWDRDDARTRDPGSPHHGLSDIWVRYAGPDVEDVSKPHESIWYPCANILPIRELVYPLMARVGGLQLGGVLITKIPAGKTCKPHVDPGWHARYYDKYAIQITSAPGQAFCFEGEHLESKPGDIYCFDNSHKHWVENPTSHDRITCIVCIRTERLAGSGEPASLPQRETL